MYKVTTMELSDKLNRLPQLSGVYLMKSIKNEVIYVGKARNLRNRVRSYFQANSDERLYRQFMIKQVVDIDTLVTDTEKEALILENNLIKQFKPRFNINLRDDKTFVSIKIDLNEAFPRLRVVRQVKKDGSLYFGPYSSAKSVRETLRYINDIYPVRRCANHAFKNRKRPCLYYQLGKCLGPCCIPIDEKGYMDLIDQITLILKGKNDELINILNAKMKIASKELKYEEAAKIRDQIVAIEKTVEKQKIHIMKFVDRDIFGFAVNEKEVCIQVMFIRSGNLTDISAYYFPVKYNNAEETFCSFLNQFYSNNNFIPKEVLIPAETEDKEVLEEFLTELKGQKVDVVKPQRGEKLKLLQMAVKNAENSLNSRIDYDEKSENILNRTAKVLNLKNLPETIECFDISNIGGELAVGAMVVFKNGEPYKNAYRKFKIRDVTQPDDFAMMREILNRRYIRAMREKDLPDLTIIDGGKGHLGVAMDVFSELNILGIDIISIAKGKQRNKTEDYIVLPDGIKPPDLTSDSPELLFIQRIRDEAHRFAIAYHRKIREKCQFSFKSDTKP